MANQLGVQFPKESAEYRSARQELLMAERNLRREVEKVAALRRKLPEGHAAPEDYTFTETNEATRQPCETRLSELFEDGKNTLVVYSFMYPAGGSPCPMCTSFLDSLNGAAPHVRTQLNLAVIAKAPIEQLDAWARKRGWSNLRLLSSASNNFNSDYLAETPDGSQVPILTVFRKSDAGVTHFYTTELFYDSPEEGQHPRHMDMMFPLWNVFDLTPEGRPENWFPKLSYDVPADSST